MREWGRQLQGRRALLVDHRLRQAVDHPRPSLAGGAGGLRGACSHRGRGRRELPSRHDGAVATPGGRTSPMRTSG
jgi:hypothetical protein